MNIETEIPAKTYPYLATWVGPEHIPQNDLVRTPTSEIVLISKNEDGHIFVQYIDGNKPVFDPHCSQQSKRQSPKPLMNW